uniref:FAD-dependent oxidoreductase domain-containing protein 1 n=1 Tax=Saccoglossus kowalevskii TaxID=10224 RepID=A0ABM0M7K6_SACKO|nr:PREDICTED: FAD-dependent oxidoreductase domain-containing protein 1-like [Saccoglossus kowalevskii]
MSCIAGRLALRCLCRTKNDSTHLVRHMSFLSEFQKSLKEKHPFAPIQFGPTDNRPPDEADIVIIGGGLVGSSIAYFLKRKIVRGMRVVVIERDPAYTRASSVLSVGGIHQQFSLPENVQMSMYGAEFLRNIKEHLTVDDADPPDVQFNPQGYLFLATEKSARQMKANYDIQRENGAKVELLTATKVKEKFPWINTDGIELASYGTENEGWFDPWCLLAALKQKAKSLGVQYVHGNVTGFTLRKDKIPKGGPYDPYYDNRIRNVKISMPNSPEMIPLSAAVVINAAGPQAGHLSNLLKIGDGKNEMSVSLPVEPRKRYVYVCYCPSGPGLDCPLVVDPTGAYFRREGLGGNYIAGLSPTQIKSAWAGFYDYNTVDQNAIIGVHPIISNFFFANGFSGHGIQQAPAIGRAMSELLLEQSYKTIDLSRFGFQRFIDQQLLYETNYSSNVKTEDVNV